jgi:hypothetical protein
MKNDGNSRDRSFKDANMSATLTVREIVCVCFK